MIKTIKYNDQNNEKKSILKYSSIPLIVKTTRLFVSGRSPECSDCLLRFYGAVVTIKKKIK